MDAPWCRALPISEAGYAYQNQFVRYMVFCEGELDIRALSAALDALVVAYPWFGGTIQAVGTEGFELSSAPSPSPEVRVHRGDPADLGFGVSSLDQGRELIGVDVVADGRSARVTLQAHHSLADGRHALALLAELWSAYTDVVESGGAKIPARSAPSPLEHHLAARGISKGAESGAEAFLVRDLPVADARSLMSTARLRLSAQDTEGMIRLGRREGLTVNGLASAALILARARLVGGQHVTVPYQFLVDVRNRVEPPVQILDGTAMLGLASFVADVTPSTDALGLARDVNRSLAQDTRKGVVQQSLLHGMPALIDGSVPPLQHLTLTTNWGQVPDLATPPGLRITDFRGNFAAHPIPCRTPDQALPADFYVLTTFENRFSAELLTTTPPHQAEQLVEHAKEQFALLVEEA